MIAAHPDLLRRFVPTPHSCVLPQPEGEVHVESNSEALVAALLKGNPSLPDVAYLKVIIDDSANDDGNALTHINSAHLQTVLRGTTTILIFDRERCELLAFISPQVSVTELLNRLIPACIAGDKVAELQTHDIDAIAP